MRTPENFLNALEDGRVIYYRGERVKSVVKHPTLGIACKHAAKLYDLDRSYHDPQLGEISLYYKIPRNSQDLIRRHKLIYSHTIACNGIFNITQAIGSDALFSLMLITKKINTKYYERVQTYYKYVAKNDLALAVAQTDVKGDRSKRPHQQEDPDLYLHVVDVNDRGIIVRGAKAHTTQSIASDELIILPTRAMREKEKDYAVSFAIPVNTEGLKLIVRPIDEVEGNPGALLSKRNYEAETLTIFDDVFIPWNRVFLFGEYEYAGPLATTFATYHRFTAITYRAAMSNLYLGAARLIAKANGIERAPHIQEDLLKIILYKEFLKATAIAAAYEPIIESEIAIPNPLYTNIGKLYANENFPGVLGALIDISGGIIATAPSPEDLENKEEKNYILKYLTGAINGKSRYEIIRLVRELTVSSFAGYSMTLMLHAEGSMQASKLALLREYDWSEAEELVEKIIKNN